MGSSAKNVAVLLAEVSQGRAEAAAKLIPLVYNELRQLARSQMRRERPDHTLQATALVHEAYLKLVGSGPQTGKAVLTFSGSRHR